MPDSITVDTAALNSWILKFHDELGVAVDKVVRYEMRMALRDIIKDSPPKNLSLGREKVRGDFRRASEPLSESAVRGGLARKYLAKGSPQSMDVGGYQIATEDVFKFQMQRAQELIAKKDYVGMNAMLRNFKGGLSRWSVVPLTADLFTGAPRGRKGGVKEQRKFVFEAGKWKRMLSQVQSHVGRLKASWLPAYYEAGGKQVAFWIHRHLSGVRGQSIPPANGSAQRVFTAISFAAGVGNTRYLIAHALHYRAQVIRKDFFMFFNGRKDLSQIE